MEEQLFTDDALYEQMVRVKASLLERNGSGALSPERRQELTQQALRSRKLRAEILAAAAGQTDPAIASIPGPASQPGLRLRRNGPRAVIGYALAAMILLTVGVLFAWRSGHRPDRRSEQAKASPAPMAQTASAAPPAVLFLPALVLRGEADAHRFQVPAQTASIELQVEVRQTGAGWSADLLQSGSPLNHWENLSENNAGDIRYLSLILPVSALPPGRYQLRLTPPGKQPAELILRRDFEIAAAR